MYNIKGIITFITLDFNKMPFIYPRQNRGNLLSSLTSVDVNPTFSLDLGTDRLPEIHDIKKCYTCK